jgi:hypothetical protein
MVAGHEFQTFYGQWKELHIDRVQLFELIHLANRPLHQLAVF